MESIDQPRIELLTQIGKGSYGEVWIARHHEKDFVKYVAVKLEHKNIPENSLAKEFKVMKTIDKHQNLI
jgi:serine/threonine protein kinase